MSIQAISSSTVSAPSYASSDSQGGSGRISNRRGEFTSHYEGKLSSMKTRAEEAMAAAGDDPAAQQAVLDHFSARQDDLRARVAEGHDHLKSNGSDHQSALDVVA